MYWKSSGVATKKPSVGEQKCEPCSCLEICWSRLKNFDRATCLVVVAKGLKMNVENTVTDQVMDSITEYITWS